MIILETDRLTISQFTTDDAPFVLELLNTPSFIKYIGDKGVRTLEESEKYLLDGPIKSYEDNGFGMYLLRLKGNGIRIGTCGLVNRPELEDVDIGFAMLPAYEGKGYGFEASKPVLDFAKTNLKISRLVAITALDNARSIALCEKLGLRKEKTILFGPKKEELNLFVINFDK